MNIETISIALSFSKAPAGRYYTDGPYSGQKFRTEVLFPALENSEKVEVDLDGTLGYGSSFLEEAFGGLIRECGLTLDQINSKLTIVSTRRLYLNRITKYLNDAEAIRLGRK